MLCKLLRCAQDVALRETESPAAAGLFLMERTGIEPVTSGLQSRRSPS